MAVNSCCAGVKNANSGCRALVIGLSFPELRGMLRAKFFTFTEVQGQKLLLLFFVGLSQTGQRAELRELQGTSFYLAQHPVPRGSML